MQKVRRDDLLYPELSYIIIGCAFDVHNNLGSGHPEKYYQRALSEAFKQHKVIFSEQVYYPLHYGEKIIGKNFADFMIDNKVIVEIKKGNQYSKQHIDQVLNYLRQSRLKLAILINFGIDAVSFRRIININS